MMETSKVVHWSIRLLLSYLKLGWDLLLYSSTSLSHRGGQRPPPLHFAHRNDGDSPAEEQEPHVAAAAAGCEAECAVCLCKVDDGDEIRELTCRHLFHRACVDRWSRYFTRHATATCPLCRRSLSRTVTSSTVPSSGGPHRAAEVLVLRFADIFGSDDTCAQETWWLR